MNISDLTPKKILFDAVINKLKPLGISKIIGMFPYESDKYNIAIQNETGEDMKIEITKDEINSIKKVLVNRINKAWLKQHPKIEIAVTIVQMNINEKKVEIFIESTDKKMYQFKF